VIRLANLLAPPRSNTAPGPRGHPLWGNLPDVRRDPIGLFTRSFREYGDVVRLRFGTLIGHLVASPSGVQHVLAENNKNYGKRTRGFAVLRYVLGDGLLTSEGELWKRQRRLAQPAFHRQRIAGFAAAMVRAASDCAGALEQRRGSEVDIHQEMMRVTLRIVGETLLGHDPSGDADKVGPSVSYLLKSANQRASRFILLPPVLPTASDRRVRQATALLDEVVLRIIAERRRRPGDDLISMLLQSRDAETGEAMSDRQLRDEAMTIFLAGHETTANALTFSFLLLSRHPDAFRDLREELARVLGGRSPTFDDLPRLVFTRMVVQEALRLYPPAWIISRSATGPDEIAGYAIPARSIVFLCPYLVHRHPRFWKDAEEFRPRRFETEPPKGAYFPFGAGPRQCIGNGFATIEAELVLATLAQRLSFELPHGRAVELDPQITLRPRGGLPMRVV
jgi:cytochrome P450